MTAIASVLATKPSETAPSPGRTPLAVREVFSRPYRSRGLSLRVTLSA